MWVFPPTLWASDDSSYVDAFASNSVRNRLPIESSASRWTASIASLSILTDAIDVAVASRNVR